MDHRRPHRLGYLALLPACRSPYRCRCPSSGKVRTDRMNTEGDLPAKITEIKKAPFPLQQRRKSLNDSGTIGILQSWQAIVPYCLAFRSGAEECYQITAQSRGCFCRPPL